MANGMWWSQRVPTRELGLSDLGIHELMTPETVVYNSRARIHKSALGVPSQTMVRPPNQAIAAFRGTMGANAIAMGLHAGGQTDGADRGLPGKDAASIGGSSGVDVGAGSRGTIGLRDVGRALSAAGAASAVVPGLGLAGAVARAIGGLLQTFGGPVATPTPTALDPTAYTVDPIAQPDINTYGPTAEVVPDPALPTATGALPEDVPMQTGPPNVALPGGTSTTPGAPGQTGAVSDPVVEGVVSSDPFEVGGALGGDRGVGSGAAAGAGAGAAAGLGF